VRVIGIDQNDLEEDFGTELRREVIERHCVGVGVNVWWWVGLVGCWC
jgi:hypothetical protein